MRAQQNEPRKLVAGARWKRGEHRTAGNPGHPHPTGGKAVAGGEGSGATRVMPDECSRGPVAEKSEEPWDRTPAQDTS